MKRDLYFSKPLMNAAGSLGFAPDARNGIDISSFGAFITNPISMRPRLPTVHPSALEFPGGFLLHSGLPNSGISSTVKKYSPRWERMNLPVIVNIMADRPEEAKFMVQMMETVDNVMAVELGFAPQLADDILLLTLEMCLGEIPLIFSLPHEQVLSLGPRLIQEGAQAISLASPRGIIMQNDLTVSGRLYGPSQFPRALELVYSAAKTGIPVIGAGGVWNQKDADDMLLAGALAVQVDARLWLPGK